MYSTSLNLSSTGRVWLYKVTRFNFILDLKSKGRRFHSSSLTFGTREIYLEKERYNDYKQMCQVLKEAEGITIYEPSRDSLNSC